MPIVGRAFVRSRRDGRDYDAVRLGGVDGLDMTSREDDVEGLKRNLERHFTEGFVKVIGCEALFWAQ